MSQSVSCVRKERTDRPEEQSQHLLEPMYQFLLPHLTAANLVSLRATCKSYCLLVDSAPGSSLPAVAAEVLPADLLSHIKSSQALQDVARHQSKLVAALHGSCQSVQALAKRMASITAISDWLPWTPRGCKYFTGRFMLFSGRRPVWSIRDASMNGDLEMRLLQMEDAAIGIPTDSEGSRCHPNSGISIEAMHIRPGHGDLIISRAGTEGCLAVYRPSAAQLHQHSSALILDLSVAQYTPAQRVAHQSFAAAINQDSILCTMKEAPWQLGVFSLPTLAERYTMDSPIRAAGSNTNYKVFGQPGPPMEAALP